MQKSYLCIFMVLLVHVEYSSAISSLQLQQLTGAKKQVENLLDTYDAQKTDVQTWQKQINALLPIIQQYDRTTAAKFTRRMESLTRDAQQRAEDKKDLANTQALIQKVTQVEQAIKQMQAAPINKATVLENKYANYSQFISQLEALAQELQALQARVTPEDYRQAEQRIKQVGITLTDKAARMAVSSADHIKLQLTSQEKPNWFIADEKGRFNTLMYLQNQADGTIKNYFNTHSNALKQEAEAVRNMVQHGIIQNNFFANVWVQKHLQPANKTNLEQALQLLTSKTNLHGAFDKVIDAYAKLITKVVPQAFVNDKQLLTSIVTEVMQPLSQAQLLLHTHMRAYLKDDLISQADINAQQNDLLDKISKITKTAEVVSPEEKAVVQPAPTGIEKPETIEQLKPKKPATKPIGSYILKLEPKQEEPVLEPAPKIINPEVKIVKQGAPTYTEGDVNEVPEPPRKDQPYVAPPSTQLEPTIEVKPIPKPTKQPKPEQPMKMPPKPTIPARPKPVTVEPVLPPKPKQEEPLIKEPNIPISEREELLPEPVVEKPAAFPDVEPVIEKEPTIEPAEPEKPQEPASPIESIGMRLAAFTQRLQLLDRLFKEYERPATKQYRRGPSIIPSQEDFQKTEAYKQLIAQDINSELMNWYGKVKGKITQEAQQPFQELVNQLSKTVDVFKDYMENVIIENARARLLYSELVAPIVELLQHLTILLSKLAPHFKQKPLDDITKKLNEINAEIRSEIKRYNKPEIKSEIASFVA